MLPSDILDRIEALLSLVANRFPTALPVTKVLDDLGGSGVDGVRIRSRQQLGRADGVALLFQRDDLSVGRCGKEVVLRVQLFRCGDRVLADLDELGDRLFDGAPSGVLHICCGGGNLLEAAACDRAGGR